jgi:carbon monoxide dehydrogenase subunit G
MHKISRLCLTGLLLLPIAVAAHGPSRQKVTEEIAISAPPQKVWDLIKDFCSIATWHPDVAKCEKEGENAAGAKRVLTLKKEGNPQIFQEMMKYDEANMTFKYKITKVDVKVLPVTTYSSFMTVAPEGSGSKVSWNGGFYRGFPNNNPPPELSDEAAVKAVTDIYKAGLENLKKLAEK